MEEAALNQINLFCFSLNFSTSCGVLLFICWVGNFSPITPVEAKRISLINEEVEEEELEEFVLNLAKKISKKSSNVIQCGKKAFYKQLDKNLSDAYEYTSKIMADNVLKDDAIEGINAFLEKRKPDFSKFPRLP